MTLLVVAALTLVALLADRVLVWCELRGWITYRVTPRPATGMRRAAGNALVSLDAFFQPERRHQAEMRAEADLRREGDEAGGHGPALTTLPRGEDRGPRRPRRRRSVWS